LTQGETAAIVGYHPVRELLRSRPQEVREVLIGVKRDDQRRRQIEALVLRHSIPLRFVSEAELATLAGGATHNGFGALVGPRESEQFSQQQESRLVVLLEDVQDPRNLGALLRVCEGAGVEKVLIRDRGSAPLGPAAVKASAGASSWVDVERIVNPARQIQQLQKDGYWVYGADERGTPPWEVDLSGPVVLCLGGEDKGLRQRTRSLCDGLLGLPMQGRIASLNVATAASALLFEVVRQRFQGFSPKT
jgi:23S rRNA (guanosine2251-2'-O)-methyltransferase